MKKLMIFLAVFMLTPMIAKAGSPLIDIIKQVLYAPITQTAVPDVPLLNIIKGVIDIPAQWNLATLYNVKYGEMNIGSGMNVLTIHWPEIKLNENWKIPAIDVNHNVLLYASQKRSSLGLSPSIPIHSFKSGWLEDLFPIIKKTDAGIFAGWGYDLTTDSNNNMYLNWSGLSYGLSFIQRF